jgi:endonuclease G
MLYVVAVTFQSCKGSNALPNGYIGTTQEGSTTMVLKGYDPTLSPGFSVCQPTGFGSAFYIRDKRFTGSAYEFVPATAAKLSEMTEAPESGWESDAAITDKTTYWLRYTPSSTSYTYVKVRVAYIEGNDVGIEYIVGDSSNRPNENTGGGVQGRFEIPHLNPDNVFVSHEVTFNNTVKVNYSLEWNNIMHHAQWVAFTFDSWTSLDNVGRTEAWAVDPLLPDDMQTNEADHRSDGFDKGHLVASEDRVYSTEANEQTFYYSNMSPQLNNFNGGFWASLERQVQTWGRSGIYQTLYVVKGGTLDELNANFQGDGASTDDKGFTKHGLACPKYYFMAILGEKIDGYKAIAFFVEHKAYARPYPKVDTYTISIRDLEKKTKLDFFCNLPNDIETTVESTYNLNDWEWN